MASVTAGRRRWGWSGAVLAAELAAGAVGGAAAYTVKSPEVIQKTALDGAEVVLGVDAPEYFTSAAEQPRSWEVVGAPQGASVTITAAVRSNNAPPQTSRDVTLTLAYSGDFSAEWSLYVRARRSVFSISTDRVFGPVAVRAATGAGLRAGPAPGRATEEGGQAAFPVRLWAQPSAAVTVSVSSLDTSEGTVAPTSLTFSTTSWNTAQTVTATGVQDTADDGDVTWRVRLDPASGDAGYGGLANRDVEVTTQDDDGPPTVTLALSAGSIAESGAGSTATVSATLSHASGAATTLTVAEGTVWTVGGDRRIVVAAGATTAPGDTVAVVAVDDDTDGPDRSAVVTATVANARAAADATTMTVTGAALTVRDDEGPPGIVLSLSPSSVTERGGVATVSAVLSHPSVEPSTLTMTAVAGHHVPWQDGRIVIAAGATTAPTDTARVRAVDDTVDEGAGVRTATVTGRLANGHGAGAVTGAVLELRDDDRLPTVELVLTPGSVLESGGVASVGARLSWPSSTAVTLTVAARAQAPGAAGDFTQSGTRLTIPARAAASTGSVTVTGVGNEVDAPDRRVTVSATVAGGHGVGAPADATLILIDDDVLTDLASGAGSVAYAKETLKTPLVSGGTTYYVASGPPAPGRWSMRGQAGQAAAGGETLQVRYILAGAVLAGAQAPTLAVEATGGAGTPLAGSVTAGGASGDDSVLFSVAVPAGRAVAADARATLTVAALGVLPGRAGTMRVETRLGTSGAFSGGDPVEIVRAGSGVRERAERRFPVVRMGDGFRTFDGQVVASVGRFDTGPTPGERFLNAEDGTPAELGDMAAPASRVIFDGDLRYVERTFLTRREDCSAPEPGRGPSIGEAWVWVELWRANGRHLCVEVDGTSGVPATSFYQISVVYIPHTGAVFPPGEAPAINLGRVIRDGASVELPHMETHAGTNFRVAVTNRTGVAAPYRFEFMAPEGTSAVGGPQAEGTLEPGSLTVLRAPEIVTLSGRETYTGARLTMEGPPEGFDVLTIQANRSDGSTDTVRYDPLEAGLEIPADPTRHAEGPLGPLTARNGRADGRAGVMHYAQWFYHNDPYDEYPHVPPEPVIDWEELARETATAYCRTIGFRGARNAVSVHPGIYEYVPEVLRTNGWQFINTGRGGGWDHNIRAGLVREWTATCVND